MHKKGREVAPVLFFCASVPVRVGAAAFGPARAQTVPPAAGLSVLSGFGARASAPTAFLPAQTARRQAALGRTSALAKACPKSPNKPASPPDAEKRRRPRGSLRRAGIMAARHRRAARGCAAGAPALAAFASPAGNHRPTIRVGRAVRRPAFGTATFPPNPCKRRRAKRLHGFHGLSPHSVLPDFVRQSAAKRQGISAA